MGTMGTSKLPVIVTHQADPPADWDDFVMECDPSHFEQTSWWANVESVDGWSSRYIVGRVGNSIEAGAMVLVRRQGRIGKVGYIFRGPLLRREPAAAARARGLLVSGMKRLSRQERLVLLVVVPPYDGDVLARELLGRGFLRHPRLMSPRDLPPGTITIDLRPGYEAVARGYRHTLQKQVKRAARKGVEVSLGSAEELETFWERHQDLCRRRGVRSNIPSYDFARRAWSELHDRGRTWMFQAKLDGLVLCSLICLGAGKWFYAWRIGWLPDSEKAYPTQAAFCRAIEVATKEGYHFFDFLEIHPDDVRYFEQGIRPNTPTSGVTFFKLGFGGTVKELPPALDWFPNPILRLFMRGIGLRLLSCRWFPTRAGRISR